MDLMDAVDEAIREVSAAVIEPRFRALQDGDVIKKAADEVVTVADTEAETGLTLRLDSILPGVPVVGEEASATNPHILAAVHADRAWLVDPLDGTKNFIHGSSDWAVMVAFVEHGNVTRSWIWQPVTQRMYRAELGSGSWCNEIRLSTAPATAPESELRGVVLSRFLAPDLKAAVARNSTRFGEITSGTTCAGLDYPAVIHGDEHFALYWRTLPWDHAPGALLLCEAGGTARRLDGTEYRPASTEAGLLIATDTATWHHARKLLD